MSGDKPDGSAAATFATIVSEAKVYIGVGLIAMPRGDKISKQLSDRTLAVAQKERAEEGA